MLALHPLIAQEKSKNVAEPVYFETVTVYANKFAENLIDVPQSITVIDNNTIEEAGMTNLADLLDVSPSFDISSTSPARKSVNIRGLNSSVFSNNNPIVLYVDGVPYSDSYGFDLSLLDVEQVEILRGPQGTLYGKNAIGGVVKVTSKEPTNEWSGKFHAEYGSYQYISSQFSTSGALKENELYLSVSGQYHSDDGWVTNHYNGNEKDANKFDQQVLRTSLIYQPTDAFRIKFIANIENTDSYGTGGYRMQSLDTGILSLTDAFSRKTAGNINAEIDTNEDSKINSQALKLNYETDPFTILSVTTHRDFKLEGIYDFDEYGNSFFNDAYNNDSQDIETWTQELIVSSNNDDGLHYVFGLYIDAEKRKQGPYGQSFKAINYYKNHESDTDSSAVAIFGQIMYPLIEDLELTLGARYQRINIETAVNTTTSGYNPAYGGNYTSKTTFNGDEDWYKFLPRIALKYKIKDNLNAYASFAQGYLPGGFNLSAESTNVGDNTFQPQVSKNYEFGIKSQSGKISFATSIFYLDIEDIHIFKTETDGSYTTGNADKAHSQGVEAEIAYQFSDSLQLSSSIGLIKAKYDDYNNGVYDYSGQTIESTPDYTLRLAASYRHENGFYAYGEVTGVGKTPFKDDGRPSPDTAFPERDAYAEVDLRLGYFQDNWEFYAYADNLTNVDYITSLRSTDLTKSYAAMGIQSHATFNDPRSFGLGVRYKF